MKLKHEIFSYQKLLKKTKVGKRADNDKNRHFLPNPIYITEPNVEEKLLTDNPESNVC